VAGVKRSGEKQLEAKAPQASDPAWGSFTATHLRPQTQHWWQGPGVNASNHAEGALPSALIEDMHAIQGEMMHRAPVVLAFLLELPALASNLSPPLIRLVCEYCPLASFTTGEECDIALPVHLFGERAGFIELREPVLALMVCSGQTYGSQNRRAKTGSAEGLFEAVRYITLSSACTLNLLFVFTARSTAGWLALSTQWLTRANGLA
jgi:hypothetical protein